MNTLAPLGCLAALSSATCIAAALFLQLRPRLSAARRHLVWLLAFVGIGVSTPLAVLPLRITVPVLPRGPLTVIAELPVETPKDLPPSDPAVFTELQSAAAPPLPVETNGSVRAGPPTAPSFIFDGIRATFTLWLLGMAWMVLRIFAGLVQVRQLKRRARFIGRISESGALTDASEGCPVFATAHVPTPLALGVWTPSILIPDSALQWPPSQLRAALLHEYSHVRRRDVRALVFAQFVLAAHWFNPLVWLALGALRKESEAAADDEATRRIPAGDYAENLLAIARRAVSHPAPLLPAMGMARPSEVSRRITQLLDTSRDRSSPGARLSASAVATTALFACMLLVLQPVAAEFPTVMPPVTRSHAPLVVRCEDEQGRPVAGAEVYLYEQPFRRLMYQDPYGIPWIPEKRTTTNAQGEVVYPNPIVFDGDQFSRLVYARVPGQLAGGRYFLSETAKDAPNMVTLKMRPVKTLKGKVDLTGERQPVTVRLLSWILNDEGFGFAGENDLGANFLERPVDANGEYVFDEIPGGARVYLSASAPGYGWSQVMTVPGQKSLPSLVLEKEAVIEGTVTEKETGRPSPGRRVLATPREGVVVRHPYTAVTDTNGRFRLAGLQGGHYLVTLAWTGSFVAPPVEVTVKSGDTVLANLEQEPGVEASGVVTSESSPVPNATVSAVWGDIGGEGLDSAITGADGRYTLLLPSGTALLYLSSAPAGFEYPREQGRRTITIRDGKVENGSLDFSLNPISAAPPKERKSARAVGRVVDEEGKPLAGVLVSRKLQLLDGDRHQVSGPLATTDANGSYDVQVWPNAKCQIMAGGVTSNSAKSKEFETRSGSVHQVEDLIVRPANATASGIVVDEKGAPLAGATVNPSSKNKYAWKANEVVADVEGRFAIPHLLPDELFDLMAGKPGYTYKFSRGIPPGTKDIRVVLHPAVAKRNGAEDLPDGERLLGQPTPALDVDAWIQGTVHSDSLSSPGTWRLVAFLTVGSEKRLQQLAALQKAGRVEPIGIFSYDVNPHYITRLLAETPTDFPIAIDRFLPASTPWNLGGATREAYGRESLYLIGPDGKIRSVLRSLDEIEKHLSRNSPTPR
jgi:beta-lactamase regulating signal transducer with metallopeptidase domain